MNVKKINSAILSIVFISAAVCSAAEKIDLKIKMAAGESHEMKMIQTQDISQTMNGQEINVKQNIEMVFSTDCLSVDANGVMDATITYKSVKMVIDSMMGHIEVDSANPKTVDANNPAAKAMAAMVKAMAGCKFQIKLKPTGEIVNLSGLSEMLNKVKKDAAGSSENDQLDEMFDKMFDEKQLKDLTGDMMGTFPAEPVAVGDSWYDTKSIDFMMPIDIDTTYMLKSTKDGVAYIDSTAKIDMGDNSKPLVEDPNNKMSMQIAGTINATNEVDIKTGLTRKSNVAMNFSGVMKIESADANEMTIPMTIKGTAVVELIK